MSTSASVYRVAAALVAGFAVSGCGEATAPELDDERALPLVASADHGPYVDQHQLELGSGTTLIGGSTDQQIAQVITSGRAGDLRLVVLSVGCQAGSTLFMEIWKTSRGRPSKRWLTFAYDEWFGAPVSWRKLYLPTPVYMPRGRTFGLVLRADGQCGWRNGPDGETYSGGHQWFRYGSFDTWNLGSRDMVFETYVR